MRILFMGTPDFAVASLRRLVADGHEVCGVFTQPDKPKNRGMKLLLLDGKLLCEPSSAIGIGAVLRGQLPVHKGDKVCFVISGGSVALEQLHQLEDVRL